MIEETAVLPMERFADDIIEEGCVEILEGGLERRESDTLGIEMVNCRFWMMRVTKIELRGFI